MHSQNKCRFLNLLSTKFDKSTARLFINRSIKLIISSLSMDPRPYHFEYRRPRLHNPT